MPHLPLSMVISCLQVLIPPHYLCSFFTMLLSFVMSKRDWNFENVNDFLNLIYLVLWNWFYYHNNLCVTNSIMRNCKILLHITWILKRWVFLSCQLFDSFLHDSTMGKKFGSSIPKRYRLKRTRDSLLFSLSPQTRAKVLSPNLSQDLFFFCLSHSFFCSLPRSGMMLSHHTNLRISQRTVVGHRT